MIRILFFMPLIFLPHTLLAAPDWQSCKKITADLERLSCYDRYANSVSGKAGKPDMDAQKTAFGLAKTSSTDELQDISSPIIKTEKTSHGKRIIHLKNQQVWRQLESGSQPRLKPGDVVTIRRGALGSYILEKQDSNRSLRVKRIR